jgi:hypothetical protein
MLAFLLLLFSLFKWPQAIIFCAFSARVRVFYDHIRRGVGAAPPLNFFHYTDENNTVDYSPA